MQFNINVQAPSINTQAIEHVLQEYDPAGMVDLDSDGQTVRISTIVLDIELVFILEQAGYPIRLTQIERVPSVCCGGCSG